jgi:uncharacterized protein YegL
VGGVELPIIESDGQWVNSNPTGPTPVEITFYCAKPGVQKVVNGKPCLGPIEEGVRQRTATIHPHFPRPGKHDVRMSVHMEPTGRLFCMASFPGTPEINPIKVPIQGRAGIEEEQPTDDSPKAFVILMDCSSSMESPKIDEAKRAIAEFANSVPKKNVQLGLIEFGLRTRVTAPMGTPPEKLITAAAELTAYGATPLHTALRYALKQLTSVAAGVEKVVIVACDGKPDDESSALEIAEKVKEQARIFSVGIGKDVDKDFMCRLASSPNDYKYGSATDLVANFQEIQALYFTPE